MKIIQSYLTSGKPQFRLFLRFLKSLLPYRAKWLIVVFLSFFTAMLGLVNPYLTKLIVDKAIKNRDLRTFVILVVIGGTVFVVTGILSALKQYLERNIKARVKLDLNKKVFTKLKHLSFHWFQGKATGEHIYKINYDIERVKDFITSIPPQVVVLFPRLILTFFIIASLNLKMAVFCLFLTPFLCISPYYFIRKRKEIFKKSIKNSESIFRAMQEFFSHIYLIKTFAKQGTETRKYIKKVIKGIRIGLTSARLEMFSNFVARSTSKFIVSLIAFYGGVQVINGKMTLGSLVAILAYLSQMIGIQSSFIGFFQSTTIGLVSCQRVADILDEKDCVVESKAARDIIFKRGDIVFNNVSFGYSPGRPVLKDLNLSIEAGSHISLVAPSGFGKTTLLNLIIRLYNPWQGEILISGVKIEDIKLGSLREQIGMVLQESFLFNDTVASNIAYGKEGSSWPEIKEAARLSLVDRFVAGLTDGYDAIIGENACKISEGQKQKIAIARALIKRPKVLIMDEAMSSMDSASEESILLNIKSELKEVTLVTVSHRLSTAANADLVYFLKGQARIVSGTCDELLQKDKEFYDLFKAQIRDSVLI